MSDPRPPHRPRPGHASRVPGPGRAAAAVGLGDRPA